MRIKYPNRLREARQQAGLKQVELAIISGVAVSTVNRIELYPFHVANETAEKLAAALKVKARDIFPYVQPAH